MKKILMSLIVLFSASISCMNQESKKRERSNSDEKVESNIKRRKINPITYTNDEDRKLEKAVIAKNPELVKDLINLNANPNAINYCNATIFSTATFRSNVEILKLLADAGADPDHADSFGRTSLHEAISSNDSNILKVVLSINPNLHAYTRTFNNSNGWTPLIHAAFRGNDECFKLLIERLSENKEALKKAIDTQDSQGRSALHFAAEFEYTDIINWLMYSGANINIRDLKNNTPLHYAIKKEKAYSVFRLIKLGCNREATNSDGLTPMQLAEKLKLEDMIYLLANVA